MAGCWQPHNMHTCCNWEVVLLVKWKNTSVITNCCCDWQCLLIRVVEVLGNVEIIWTLSRSPGLHSAIGQASHPSSHRIWTLLSWPRSGSLCGWTEMGREKWWRKNTWEKEYGWFRKCFIYSSTEQVHHYWKLGVYRMLAVCSTVTVIEL